MLEIKKKFNDLLSSRTENSFSQVKQKRLGKKKKKEMKRKKKIIADLENFTTFSCTEK